MSTPKIVSSAAITTASVLVHPLVVALVIRDQMFSNSPALQADLLVVETEKRIGKDGYTGLHVSNGQNGQKYLWRIFQVKLLVISTPMVITVKMAHYCKWNLKCYFVFKVLEFRPGRMLT